MTVNVAHHPEVKPPEPPPPAPVEIEADSRPKQPQARAQTKAFGAEGGGAKQQAVRRRDHGRHQ